MLLIRAVLLELLVCLHAIGAAVLFRRIFPRESPWLGFFIPILVVTAVLNFVEHFIALPSLGWLLPFTVGGSLWAILRPGFSWDGLRLPTILFLSVFTWAFFLKCMNPEITCNTEGVPDMARVLDFCLGDKLPPTDTWCPPYDHGGYYTFQHYGASLLKRLFSLDIGTGYNMSYNLLNTLTLLAGTGAAYAISGRRTWVALATLLVLLANFTGSAVVLIVLNALHPSPAINVFDSRLCIDIGDDWNNPARHNPFGWIFHHDPPALRLFTPAFNTYFPEFHANLSGHFLTLASLLAANETFKAERSNWPWICLLVLPLLTIIAATWFFIVVAVLCAGCLGAALLASKRPMSWRFVFGGACTAAILIWPSVNSLLSGDYPASFHWTPWAEYTPPWEFVIQWWPALVPWFLLFFVWGRLNLLARWLLLMFPLMLIFLETATFGDRGLTVEKMWGALYGMAFVSFFPLVFAERNPVFRAVTIFFLMVSAIFFFSWGKICTTGINFGTVAFHLQGDTVFQNDAQKKRLLQVMKQMRGVTILPGKSAWAYNQAPSLIGFSENKCYIAWYFQEYQCGHAVEAEYRDRTNNDFYDGKMADPLPFLRHNDIAAVLIWPEDEISDALLQQFKAQLGSDYYYIDCHEGGPHNAGLFIRQPTLNAPAPKPAPSTS